MHCMAHCKDIMQVCSLCAQDVLKFHGATQYGSGPPVLGCRSPRESYNIQAEDFMRERGSYQDPVEHP